MASITISGEELLDTMETRLQHMVDCERWLFDFYDDEAARAHLKTRYADQKWELEAIAEAENFVLQTRAASLARIHSLRSEAASLAPTLSVVEIFLSELPRLRDAAKKVTRLIGCIYGFPEIPREERIRLAERRQQTLDDRLRSLCRFDDSE